jgi:zinc transporter 9
MYFYFCLFKKKEIDHIQTTQDVEMFMLKHGENIVDRVGGEIDRIERNLRVS